MTTNKCGDCIYFVKQWGIKRCSISGKVKSENDKCDSGENGVLHFHKIGGGK